MSGSKAPPLVYCDSMVEVVLARKGILDCLEEPMPGERAEASDLTGIDAVIAVFLSAAVLVFLPCLSRRVRMAFWGNGRFQLRNWSPQLLLNCIARVQTYGGDHLWDNYEMRGMMRARGAHVPTDDMDLTALDPANVTDDYVPNLVTPSAPPYMSQSARRLSGQPMAASTPVHQDGGADSVRGD